MNVIEAAGLFVIGVILLILILFSIRNDTYISIRNFAVLFLVLSVAMAVMVYNFDMSDKIRWDLWIHYDTLSKMQKQGLDYVLHESEYKNLIFINAYFYLVALIGDFKLLSVLPVFIDFLCAFYMIQDQLRLRYGKTVPVAHCAYVSGLWFMSYGLALSISGVRCVLAMALGVLGLYLEYYKREHRGFGVFLYIAALMTHSLGAAIPLIRILLFVKKKILLLIALIAGCILFAPVASVLSSVLSFSYLKYLLFNIAKYWTSFGTVVWFLGKPNSERSVYLCYIIICFFNLYMVVRIRKKYADRPEDRDESRETYRAWNLLSTIAVLYVTGLFNALFTERLTYILAYSFPLSVPLYLGAVEHNRRNTVLHLFMLAIFFWMFFFKDLYMILVNFTGSYFLAM